MLGDFYRLRFRDLLFKPSFKGVGLAKQAQAMLASLQHVLNPVGRLRSGPRRAIVALRCSTFAAHCGRLSRLVPPRRRSVSVLIRQKTALKLFDSLESGLQLLC